MKKYTLIFALFLFGICTSNANDPAYIKAMAKQLEALEKAQTTTDFQEVANGFNRIAEKNSEEWLADYYAGLALVNAGFRSQEGIKEKDAFYHEAKNHVEKAIKAHGENAELLTLKGYALMGELSADPGSRGQHMSSVVMGAFGKALSMDPENPRAMVMMAQMELGMAQFFGQGPEKACGMAQKSMQLFEKEAAKTSEKDISPRWGKDMAEQMITQCK
ncbi:hypothetical protein JKA74_18245 [Marivirga sp. S37H4]|uniref:Uncharacterized protein n=1 Tax=Marivirga aurantiaca TaxID=2802615 RepID=A0A934X1Z0_9BACT|nr:hypothetical protein [Marivirga aurantiaca]MBK6266991.1 hypothetical protein [Marivirga aurantiaca]